MIKTINETEIFDEFFKEFESLSLCFYCLLSTNTTRHLAKLPDEQLFRYINLCKSCSQDPKIEVK
ncbi:hypothetical protein ES707_21685 [subsurface metagenome]